MRASQGERPFTVEGRGAFEGARLVGRDPPILFTNVSGRLAFRGNTIAVRDLSADVGGGRVEAQGDVTLDGASVAGLDFQASASSVRLSYPEGLRSEIEGSFRLLGDPDHLRLSGEVTLDRSLLSRDISVESELLQSLSRVGAATGVASPFASSVRLDIRVRAGEALRIDNNLARMEASVNLTVGGTLDAPELTGIVAARPGGNFRFGGNTYRIETARIQLRGYPAEPPVLDITARTSVAGEDIQLVLRGPTDNLSTELTSPSEPTLSRGDIASLLLTGRTLDKISSEGRTIVGERMVSYLGATLADLAQLGIGTALPFTIVTVEPALIAGEADPGVRFTLGARFKNSLSLVYSIGLDNAEDQIWIVDYELPRRTRAQLVRNQDNDYTIGISQELRFDVRGRQRRETTPEATVASVDVGFTGVERPAASLQELARRLDVDAGDRYDYWRAWEAAEELRRRLRERSYLEATVDLKTTPAGEGRVALAYDVALGPEVRFVFEGDELDGSLKKSLVGLWNGSSDEAFLQGDLATFAEGRLYEKRYFEARVEVAAQRSPDELVVTVTVDRGPRGKRVEVELEGNDSLPAAVLLQALPEPSSSAFHDLIATKRPRLKQLLALQYASYGYVAVSISDPELFFDTATGVLHVRISVVEGARFLVAGVELEGVSSIEEEALRSRLSLRKGEPFQVTRFVKDRGAIATFYRDRGFPDVEVDADIVRRTGAPELEERFVVREGAQIRVGKVEIEGNDVTRDSVIRRELDFEPGEPLSASAVNETQKRLYDLGIFRSAEITVRDKGAQEDERTIQVAVRETPELELDYGLRASTDGSIQALGELRLPNLFGRAQHVGLRALVGREHRIFRLGYHSPYLSLTRLDTDFFLERDYQYQPSEPTEGDPSQESLAYADKTWTFTAQQTRSLARELTAQWSYTFKRVVTVYDDPDFEGITQDRALLTASLIGDYRNNLVRPTAGSLWSVTVQAAPPKLGSDLKFAKLYGQLFTYVPLGGDVVWASGFRFGGASFEKRLAETDRFQAGGPNSVRGFAGNSLGPIDPDLLRPAGGAGLLIFNQEMRFPLVWKLRGAGFWDAGNTFELVSDIRLSELRHSAGAGVRLELPFGLLRFDWAWVLGRRTGEDPWRFVFSLGNAF